LKNQTESRADGPLPSRALWIGYALLAAVSSRELGYVILSAREFSIAAFWLGMMAALVIFAIVGLWIARARSQWPRKAFRLTLIFAALGFLGALIFYYPSGLRNYQAIQYVCPRCYTIEYIGEGNSLGDLLLAILNHGPFNALLCVSGGWIITIPVLLARRAFARLRPPGAK